MRKNERIYLDAPLIVSGPLLDETGGGEPAPAEVAPASPIPAPESLASPPRGALTLYAHEDWLLCLRDSAEGLTEAQETERLAILDEIGLATEAARRKRDGVAHYLRELDAIEERASAEIAWLSEQRRKLSAHRERVRAHVTAIVEQYAPDAEKGARRLDGDIYALALRRNPDSIEILDLAAVPGAYKRVAVKLAATDWYAMVRAAADAGFRPAGKLDVTEDADKRAIKAAIDGGEDVVGADIAFGGVGLMVRLRR